MMSVGVFQGIRIECTTCYTCGIPFGMPADYYENRLLDHKLICCPNGHELYFGPGKVERLEKEVARERARADQMQAEAKRQKELREAAERRESAAKGQVTKIKRRASAGVCPCCNRSFQNLRRHMETKHADFTSELKAIQQRIAALPAVIRKTEGGG